jgi:hypothetical protein
MKKLIDLLAMCYIVFFPLPFILFIADENAIGLFSLAIPVVAYLTFDYVYTKVKKIQK